MTFEEFCTFKALSLVLSSNEKEVFSLQKSKSKTGLAGVEALNNVIIGRKSNIFPKVKNVAYVLDVKSFTLTTSIPNVYAIGDCTEIRNNIEGRKSIEPNWYIAKIMGETVAQTICSIPTRYQQSFWSNAAKYFDISYQSYGFTPAILPENVSSCYWHHPRLEKSIRIYYASITKNVLGICVMGIRFRQAICQLWIENNSHIHDVISQLHKANFDPEFSHCYQYNILQHRLNHHHSGAILEQFS